MKKKLCQLLAALCVLPATLATAQTQTSPVGYWEAVFYYAPGGGHYANQGVCFSANNTWYGTTQHWNGNWFLNGAEFEWYGTAPIVQGGTFNEYRDDRHVAVRGGDHGRQLRRVDRAGYSTFVVGQALHLSVDLSRGRLPAGRVSAVLRNG
ncbi:hypothetical protein ACNSZF_32375 [Burkholderia gladioli]